MLVELQFNNTDAAKAQNLPSMQPHTAGCPCGGTGANTHRSHQSAPQTLAQLKHRLLDPDCWSVTIHVAITTQRFAQCQIADLMALAPTYIQNQSRVSHQPRPSLTCLPARLHCLQPQQIARASHTQPCISRTAPAWQHLPSPCDRTQTNGTCLCSLRLQLPTQASARPDPRC